MKDASTIANAFLKLSRPEIGDCITNLKLQKLLYYAQGFHLALRGRPLFNEDILAWEYGPVVKDVYKKFSKYGGNAIPSPKGGVVLDVNEKKIITGVWKIYGQFSAWKLKDMTHSERPWKETDRNEVISRETLKSFFSDLITN